MKNYEATVITWDGMEIEISFFRKWSKAFFKSCDFNLCHFQVTTLSPERAALPITGTGYRSIFITEPEIADFANPVDYVIAMLDDAAKSPEWQATREKAQQYTLF